MDGWTCLHAGNAPAESIVREESDDGDESDDTTDDSSADSDSDSDGDGGDRVGGSQVTAARTQHQDGGEASFAAFAY